MPLRWSIDPTTDFIEIVGEGDVVREHVSALLAAMQANKVQGYRKLVDLAAADTSMSRDELFALGVRLRGIHGTARMGPLALVAPRRGAVQAEAFFGMMAAADRPMRLFRDAAEARQWLLTQPSRTTDP